MTEETAPVEQAQAPQQQANVDWKARFDGQVRKIEELTLASRGLNEQLVAKTSEIEQLRGQLSLKDTEKTVAVGERDRTIQELSTAKSGTEAELVKLRAMALKVKVATDLKRPDLISVLETIPDITDEEALKTVLTTLSGYADSAVAAREKQLMAGFTPAMQSGGTTAPGVPSTSKEWEDRINSMPLGSKERQKANDDHWNWLVAKNQA